MALGAEDAFGERLAKRLRPMIPKRYFVETKRSVLYDLAFDDEGVLELAQNREREPTRGGGTGFEQDLLVFERSKEGHTSIVPRVCVELKFRRVSTHDSIVYSEKARRIRSVYPYVRYGLILGGMPSVPGRTLRLGTEFDFILALPEPVGRDRLERVAKLLRGEVRLSRRMTSVLRGHEKVGLVHRKIQYAADV